MEKKDISKLFNYKSGKIVKQKEFLRKLRTLYKSEFSFKERIKLRASIPVDIFKDISMNVKAFVGNAKASEKVKRIKASVKSNMYTDGTFRGLYISSNHFKEIVKNDAEALSKASKTLVSRSRVIQHKAFKKCKDYTVDLKKGKLKLLKPKKG